MLADPETVRGHGATAGRPRAQLELEGESPNGERIAFIVGVTKCEIIENIGYRATVAARPDDRCGCSRNRAISQVLDRNWRVLMQYSGSAFAACFPVLSQTT
jgi:hypothetical protein